MGEFLPDWLNLYVGIFVAVIVGISALVGLYRWKQYRKPPAIDAFFLINPHTEKQSTAKTIDIPTHDCVIYFTLGVNDSRKYDKPYTIVKFPPPITVYHIYDYNQLWYGKQPKVLNPHEAGFFGNELTLSKKQLQSLVFPLYIRPHETLGEHTIIVEIGAGNINAKSVEIALTLRIVKNNYSHDAKYFDPETFSIHRA